MKPIREMWAGMIDITYYCGRECVYCTRCDRHLGKKRYHMSLEDVEKALISYKDFPGWIGIIGGEPLFYPYLSEACELIRHYFPNPANKVAIWTSIDPQKSKYGNDIFRTFGHVHYHPHTKEQEQEFSHQPLTISIKDVIKNEKLRNALIDDCWLQRKWCPTITNDGAFFCETAASIAKLLGIKGWEVEPTWWKRNPSEFGYQKDLCQYCGMCIPMERQKMEEKQQKISPSFLKILRDNNLPTGNYELFDKQITIKEMVECVPNWKPGVYKTELLYETFPFSTIDFSKFED
jgi:hypothetical protein